jgi:DNA repair protein RadA/Sms
VTKSGDIAGPRVLEHMVDAVLQLEGSERSEYRLLKATKNRFGSTSEVGVFSMTGEGMIDVSNPSDLFLGSNVVSTGAEGSAVAVIMEGSRPILAEIQCLVGQLSVSRNKIKFRIKVRVEIRR